VSDSPYLAGDLPLFPPFFFAAGHVALAALTASTHPPALPLFFPCTDLPLSITCDRTPLSQRHLIFPQISSSNAANLWYSAAKKQQSIPSHQEIER
jgi:hypothetical protein